MKMPTLSGLDTKAKRAEIKEYFNFCYDRYNRLFEIVINKDAYYKVADSLRHPIIFYYGHTACFYINKLKLFKAIDEGINPILESMFAIGVDEMSWDDLNIQHYDWPTVEETKEYRQKVKDLVNNIIDKSNLTLPIEQNSIWWVILMGIEHENIHLETSSVLIRQLPIKDVSPTNDFKEIIEYKNPPINKLIKVPKHIVNIGKNKHKSNYYGWDNEYGVHSSIIPEFSASKYLVSNGEFLNFVNSGGYENKDFWSKEGWQWKEFENATSPRFWIKSNSGYKLRLISSIVELPLSYPVEVNFHEAMAFCKYKSKQLGTEITLPTEDEYIAIREYSNAQEPNSTHRVLANINLEYSASSCSVDKFKHGEFYDIIGNVWQWSKTPIYPFEKFKVHPIYDDFTVPTFDGKHNLIKGGSFISCGNLALLDSRYAFRKHFYQHAGFRYINSSYEEKISSFEYTTDKNVSIYCHFGWSNSPLNFGNYAQECVDLACKEVKNFNKALDVGCATGRSTFELGRYFNKVVGLDFSTRFIQEAQKLKDSGKIYYTMPTEGELEEFKEIYISRYNLEHTRDKVEFWQADACNLKPIYSGYDLIFASNLIDRLYDPKKFLESIKGRLNSGGVLFLSSPYSWSEDFTPKAKWIGGYKKDGENFSSLDGLKEILENDFNLINVQQIEFTLQESKRRYQYTVAEATIWRLK